MFKYYKIKTTPQITRKKSPAFKRVGMFNDIHGRENHLIKVQGYSDYKPPAIDDEPEPVVGVMKKKECKVRKRKRTSSNKRKGTKKKARH